MTEQYQIEVVANDVNEVVKSFTSNSLQQAERLERGVMINLDHEKFYTRIVEPATHGIGEMK